MRVMGAALAGLIAWGAAATVTAGAGAAEAADVRVRVGGVRSGDGTVLVTLCSPATFLARRCAHSGRARARPGTTTVIIRGVPPGVYAAQAVHDENDNFDLDRGAFGIPTEGIGFSRNAPINGGPPLFADAAVEVSRRGGTLAFAMRYF